MKAATFFVRYLLLPTTFVASSVTLAVLSRALPGALGSHSWTASMLGALVVLGASLGLWEYLTPAASVFARRTPRQRRGDVLYTVQTATGTLASERALTWLSSERQGGVGGYSLASLPLAAQIVIAFFVAELLVYLLHLACHRSGIRWLWELHAVHHRPEGLSLLSASRSHFLDLMSQGAALAPVAFLGATPEAITWCFFFEIMVGAFQHADLDMRMGHLNWLIPGPEIHRIHHHIDPEKALSFSLNAPLLDLLFRTEGPLAGPGEVPMGVHGEPD